jgi:hypothetical protein
MLTLPISWVFESLRRFASPRRWGHRSNIYENPYLYSTQDRIKAVAWERGHDPNDINGNPYPKNSDLWHAWQEGDLARKRACNPINSRD